MIDDLKKQEGVDCVRGLRTGRDQPNSCAAFTDFHRFSAPAFVSSLGRS